MAKNRKQPGRTGGGALGGDVQAVIRRAQKMREEMLAVQEELATTTAQGSVADGKVVATVNGAGELVDLRLDSSVVNPEEPDLLSDLVLSAVRAATEAMSVITEERMGPYAEMIQGI